ncbi:hypothetical protein F4553_001603 [Allocatelliglobosispora scoriae]|uniref:Secreted protein n=1 Tax=Allocatelliglobosispora scoriae TaxID=643052 RepID=A0A841BIY5_9ACTN|nr:hypothetical protein [Allocatelliglobosispora scoriae]MBB5868224.1 hypothetical protein [Allocatelliglobosispora scoriae]
MKATRFATLLSLCAVVTAGTIAGTATGAAAAPTGCTITYGSNWAQSICTGGTGQHRINMLQQHFMPGAGGIICNGNWAEVGQISYTPCANHTIVNVWITTQG